MYIKDKEYIVYGNGKIGKEFVDRYHNDNIVCILDKNAKRGTNYNYHGVKVYNPDEYLNDNYKKEFIVIAIDNWLPVANYLEKYNLLLYYDFVPYSLVEKISPYIDGRIFLLNSFKYDILRKICDGKKSVLYYGMCHKLYYMEYLSKCSEFSKEYIFIDIPNVNDIHHDSYEILKRKDIWNYCDVLICSVFEDILATKWGIMPTSQIKKLVGAQCKVITVTPAIFKGYFPQTIDAHSNIINSKMYEYFTWGDRFINKMCKSESSIEEIILQLSSGNYLPKAKIVEYIKSSIENLRLTEKQCDVKIADYIEDNYDKNIIYFSPTHANDDVMQEISKRLLSAIGVNFDSEEVISVYMSYDTHEVPIYPCVVEAIGINSDWNQRKVNCGDYFRNKQKLNFVEYIQLYYKKWFENRNME